MDRQISTIGRNDMSIRVPLTLEEQARFRAYVAENGLNIGKFLRKLIVREIDNKSGEVVNG